MYESNFLQGIALSNYRGIASQSQFVGPFKKFNFFVGANNAGKSTFLNFISLHLKPLVCLDTSSPNSRPQLTEYDLNFDRKGHAPVFGMGFWKESLLKRVIERNPKIANRPPLEQLVKSVLGCFEKNGLLWFGNERNGAKPYLETTQGDVEKILKGSQTRDETYELWNLLTGSTGGSVEVWRPQILNSIYGVVDFSLPVISLIPAIREISGKGQEFNDWSGRGLIDELVKYQNPGALHRNRSAKFKKINEFLKSVIDNDTAEIEIPYDREHVLVHMDSKVLPLSSLGTGIHEVVMLAAFCTLASDEIVCIEEPELHLHPLLQRRLINYLKDKTVNQYFVSTHSASVIDSVGAAVFHVSNSRGSTQIDAALTNSHRFDVCRDLGYKASDILQANAIIWVEGPSDRIYINHWISSTDKTLREGVDYSIMFYGGRLLSHLTASDNEGGDQDIAALIAVRQLNRNLAVVIDSDRKNRAAGINQTKTRVADEVTREGGVVWITQGR